MAQKFHPGYGVKWQLVGAFAGVCITANSVIPLWFPKKTRRFYQYYDLVEEKPALVSDHALMLANDVIDRLQLPREKSSKIDFFITYNHEPQYHGSFYSKYYCLLGLPQNINWQTPQDCVFFQNAQLNEEKINKIKEYLLMTEDEKRFLIARQMGYLDSYDYLVKLVQRLFILSTAYYAGHLFNYRSRFYTELSAARRTNYKIAGTFIICGMFGLVVNAILGDLYNISLDKQADEYAGTIGLDFARAGVKYYERLINTNIETRTLSKTIEATTTANGNHKQGVFRVKTLPLHARKENMSKLVGAFERKEKERMESKDTASL